MWKRFNIYMHLKDMGVRAFFAPECLTAAGAKYEAGIYHALHTSKVMLLVCSNADYLTSPWVRSEWSRYLALMDDGEEKRLVPLMYGGFEAGELPEEIRFRNLQGILMGKFGSKDQVTEVVREALGMKPAAAQPASETAAPAAGGGTDNLLQRARMFLADGEWQRADEYAEKVLDLESQNAWAYAVKLLAQYRLAEVEHLRNQSDISFEGNNNYQKAFHFGDAALKAQLTEADKVVRARMYDDAMKHMQAGAYAKAREILGRLNGYRDAAQKAGECARLEAEVMRQQEEARRQAEEARLAEIRRQEEAKRQEEERLRAEALRRQEEERQEAIRRKQAAKRGYYIRQLIFAAIVAFAAYLIVMMIPGANERRWALNWIPAIAVPIFLLADWLIGRSRVIEDSSRGVTILRWACEMSVGVGIAFATAVYMLGEGEGTGIILDILGFAFLFVIAAVVAFPIGYVTALITVPTTSQLEDMN